jgi:hypothetical protein
MQWISEPDATEPTLTHYALVVEADSPIEPAYVEFWKRILADGCAHAASSGWHSLSVEICERQSEADDQGFMHAKFRDGQGQPCADVGEYFLRSDAFTCLEAAGEDRTAERRRQLVFFLDQYSRLKEAAASPEVRPLLDRISSIRPLTVEAAAGYGWFDLQIGQQSFGPLPADDRATLEHREASSAEVLLELAGGDERMEILQELTAALVDYTPSTFDVICCGIVEGIEDGQRALFYDIECPSFPDDGTNVVNDRVHAAATRLVRHMAPAEGTFPGIALRLEQQKDGSWHHTMTLMSKEAA